MQTAFSGSRITRLLREKFGSVILNDACLDSRDADAGSKQCFGTGVYQILHAELQEARNQRQTKNTTLNFEKLKYQFKNIHPNIAEQDVPGGSRAAGQAREKSWRA